MSNLRDFIATRRAEITAQISALRAELDELKAAETAVSSKGPSDGGSDGGTARPRRKENLTLREMTLDVLRDQPEGADKRTIVQMIKERHGADVSTASLTTELSRLKTKKLLDRTGLVWRLGPEAS